MLVPEPVADQATGNDRRQQDCEPLEPRWNFEMSVEPDGKVERSLPQGAAAHFCFFRVRFFSTLGGAHERSTGTPTGSERVQESSGKTQILQVRGPPFDDELQTVVDAWETLRGNVRANGGAGEGDEVKSKHRERADSPTGAPDSLVSTPPPLGAVFHRQYALYANCFRTKFRTKALLFQSLSCRLPVEWRQRNLSQRPRMTTESCRTD